MSKDKSGREYLKLDECKEGLLIELDSHFECTDAKKQYLRSDVDGEWYINCEHGSHYLDGNLEPEGYFIGIYKL